MAGGNFCDTIVNGDILTFAIGSAAGKGIGAATAAAMAWAQFRTAAALNTSPDRIVRAISEAIADGRNMPVKIFVGSLNQKTGILHYCNAGNSTPLLYNEEISLLPDEENQPAGAQSGYAYTASQATIAPGKLLFLYTDGVTEAEDANHKKLGEKQLRGMALQAIKLNARPEAFFKNIQKAVTDFTGGIPQADDLTLMVISRTQSGETRKTV
jgi:sigma-B regulation protein RsbU (phosphoserine phosphatase)